MSLLVVKGNIVAALTMKGWYVRICILYTTHYHHHTVQLVMPAHTYSMCLCTSINGLVGIEKHYQCKLQVMTTTSTSEGLALVDDWKNTTQCMLQRVKTVMGTSRSS